MHDSILRTSVSASPVAKYFGLEDILPRASSETDRLANPWLKCSVTAGTRGTRPSLAETPGDLEGIHQAILSPNTAPTATRPSRIWDRCCRREADTIARRKAIRGEAFHSSAVPSDVVARRGFVSGGLKNRAIPKWSACSKQPLHPRTMRGFPVGIPDRIVSGAPLAATPADK